MRKLLCAVLFVAANYSFAAQAPQPPTQQPAPQPVPNSDCVDMTVAPSQPSIITADFQYNDTTTISAPWFAFTVNVANHCDKPVTIIALQMNSTGKRDDGADVTKQITISPSMYNFTQTCSGGTTQEVTFTDFGQFDPGQSGPLTLTPRQGDSQVMVCGAVFTPLQPLIYAGGNPNVSTDHVQNYNFNVDLSPAGWFGTVTQPDSKFQKTISFVTQ